MHYDTRSPYLEVEMTTLESSKTKTTTYSGYRSYDYLEPGTDYRPFKLAAEVSRVARFVVPVTDEQENRVRRS